MVQCFTFDGFLVKVFGENECYLEREKFKTIYLLTINIELEWKKFSNNNDK